ncbi:hypothetical protein CH373_09065 [Leptospira perolatii]|uniref:Uncharacterized protein n=1 Tax=Leptospira perolatii TaxID=2023191 RepID=A0A2M9ZNS3_9LEPT|nr:hypothetical protein CH360_10210 [Leptospira perolatii]PJZ73629.1 hypothetical protein CH373_09065 [Leptospira perolatii]
MGGTFSSFASRKNDSSKETFWIRGESCLVKRSALIFFKKNQTEDCPKGKAFLEKRNGVPLISFSLESDLLYFSYGNRFKPLQHRFFLRQDFSALYKVEQPLEKSVFLGGKISHAMFGLYSGLPSSHSSPGWFLKPYKNYLEFAASFSQNAGHLLVQFPSYDANSRFGSQILNRYSFRLEISQTTEGNKGFTSAFWKNEEGTQKLAFLAYTGQARQLYFVSEFIPPEERANLVRATWEIESYHRLEVVHLEKFSSDLDRTLEIAKSFTGKFSLFPTSIGSLLLHSKFYKFLPSGESVWAKGIYWGYKRKNWNWEIGQEWRKNGDRISEIQLLFDLQDGWKIQSSILHAEEKNRFPAFIEEPILQYDTGLLLTDRSFYANLRVSHPNFSAQLRHSREKSGKGDSLSLRFEFCMPIPLSKN